MYCGIKKKSYICIVKQRTNKQQQQNKERDKKMKTNEEIKQAYFNLMEQAASEYEAEGKMNDGTRQRLVKGYNWMEQNGFSSEMWEYADENCHTYFMQSIRNEAEGIEERQTRKSLREMHGAYCETMGIRYNAATRQYQTI